MTKITNKELVTTKEVRHILWECQRKLIELQKRAKVGTERYRYISILWSWIWTLRQIQIKDAKNMKFLDIGDLEKIRSGWLKEKLEEGDENGI